jgi:hypothetical protein
LEFRHTVPTIAALKAKIGKLGEPSMLLARLKPTFVRAKTKGKAENVKPPPMQTDMAFDRVRLCGILNAV